MPVLVSVMGGIVCVFGLGAVSVTIVPDAIGLAGAHAMILASGVLALSGGGAIFLLSARRARPFLP